MDDPNRGNAPHEHPYSVSTPVRLSVADEGNNDFSLVVTPSPGSIDPSTAPRNLPVPSNQPPMGDNSLQRPNSIHSRPSSIAKPRAQTPPRPRSDMASSEPDLQQNPGIPMQAEAPYHGPSGPSHPYQMYPQRAMSISTISAGNPGPEGPYEGSRGPAHDYGLYSQSTPAAELTHPRNIPLGFSGLTNAFPRRLGLGSDDAGSLVGSVAPSEDLPPYTRYPDNGVGPKPTNPQPTVGGSSSRGTRPRSAAQPTASSNIARILGAGGIGLATRDPEFASTPSEPGSPRSVRSFTSDASRHGINTAAAAAAGEKPTREPWRKQATKKLWGIIPYWAVGLLGAALVLMGVILGAVIGTILSKNRDHKKGGRPEHRPYGDTNSTQEVILLEAVPDDLSDLQIGAYGLLPLMVSQAPNTCFENADQSQAWTCNTPINLVEVDVRVVAGAPPTSAYELRFAPSKDSSEFTKYAWGAKTPAIPEHETLRLVRDPAEPDLGPAWWVRKEYNKTVILPEDKISPLTEKGERRKRRYSPEASAEEEKDDDDSDEADSDDDPKGKPEEFHVSGAEQGDKAWICTWPDTVLEVFIYPQQNNTLYGRATESVSGFPGYPAPTSTTNPFAGEVTPKERRDAPKATEGANPARGRPDPNRTRPDYPPLPPPYPLVVKVSERRVDGLADAVAYCEQVEIIDGGQNHRPVVDGKGRAVRVDVPEQTRARLVEGRDTWARAGEVVGRERPAGDCGCVWMVE